MIIKDIKIVLEVGLFTIALIVLYLTALTASHDDEIKKNDAKLEEEKTWRNRLVAKTMVTGLAGGALMTLGVVILAWDVPYYIGAMAFTGFLIVGIPAWLFLYNAVDQNPNKTIGKKFTDLTAREIFTIRCVCGALFLTLSYARLVLTHIA